jgi:hypothetical protein
MPFVTSAIYGLPDLVEIMRSIALLVFTTFAVGVTCGQVEPQNAQHCQLEGTVFADNGKPLKSYITAFQMVVIDGVLTPSAKCTTQTDDVGHFQCNSITSGRYLVMAKGGSDRYSIVSPSEAGYPFSFYPNATASDEALIIELSDGENYQIRFTLSQSQSMSISGAIPVRAKTATLSLAVHEEDYDIETGIPVVYEPDTGRFTIDGVPYGNYLLTASWNADGTEHHGSAVLALGPAAMSIVKVQESIPARIEGTIHWSGGEPARRPSSIVLYGRLSNKRRKYIAQIDKNGSFSFPFVQEGDYVVKPSPGDNVYVYSVSIHGKELPNQYVTVQSGAAPLSLDVELSAKAASISGVVSRVQEIDGDCGVVIESVESGQVRALKADSRGHFVATGLGPGEYRLYAWPSLEEVQYGNPLFLRRFVDRSTTVSLHEAMTATQVDVPLIEGANLY